MNHEEPLTPAEPTTPADAPSPEEMARLMATQRERYSARDLRLTTLIVWTWGAVWTITGLVLWSSRVIGGNPWFRLPDSVEWWIPGILGVFGIVVSTVLGIRMGRGRRGPSSRSGAMFGVSFFIAMVAGWLFVAGMIRTGLTVEQATVLYPAVFMLVMGSLYMAGAGFTRDVPQFVTGIITALLAGVAAFVGAPHHFLVFALAGLVLMYPGIGMWRRAVT